MKLTSRLAGVAVGPGHPVRLMGVINVSPESFYKNSIHQTSRSIEKAAEALTREGADFIDIGAMSTAPYLTTTISISEEISRLVSAVRLVRRQTSLPISIDTTRSQVAQAGLDAGARIINDISGLSSDPTMAAVAKKAAGVILMAHPNWAVEKSLSDPIKDTKKILKKILMKALSAGISRQKIVLDPGLGFFRKTQLPWWAWDLSMINHYSALTTMPAPFLVAVSRKSFIGHVLGEENPEQRLAGSLAATVIAVLKGAALVRTHDVSETKKALLIVEHTKKPL